MPNLIENVGFLNYNQNFVDSSFAVRSLDIST